MTTADEQWIVSLTDFAGIDVEIQTQGTGEGNVSVTLKLGKPFERFATDLGMPAHDGSTRSRRRRRRAIRRLLRNLKRTAPLDWD